MRVVSAVLLTLAFAVAAAAQQPAAGGGAVAPPVVAPVGEGVYIFQYRGYQSLFVVDPGGVLVTDPVSAESAKAYLAEIRKLTQAPIR